MNLHVPQKSHEKLMKAVTKERPISIKLDLTGTSKDKLYSSYFRSEKEDRGCCCKRKKRYDVAFQLTAGEI